MNPHPPLLLAGGRGDPPPCRRYTHPSAWTHNWQTLLPSDDRHDVAGGRKRKL